MEKAAFHIFTESDIDNNLCPHARHRILCRNHHEDRQYLDSVCLCKKACVNRFLFAALERTSSLKLLHLHAVLTR